MARFDQARIDGTADEYTDGTSGIEPLCDDQGVPYFKLSGVALDALAPSTVAGAPQAPKDVPTSSAESIVSGSVPASKMVRVQVEWNEALKSEYVCVGDSSVTLANGIQLSPGDSYTEEVNDAAKLFCIGSTSGLKLRVQVL